MKRLISESRRRERLLTASIVTLCALLLLGALLPLKVSAEVYGSLLRFHVVANSDSAADQAMKYRVRDRLLEWTGEGLSACRSREEAASFLASQRGELLRRVRALLREEGVQYSASICLEEEYHAAKVYGELTLPQGEYLTLRVTLGKGVGKNFFCVLFPPICQNTARASSEGEILVEYGMDEANVNKLVTEPMREYRFFVWDFISRLFQL